MVLALGVVAVVLGSVFVFQGFDKGNWMTEAMQQEKITIGIDEASVAKGDVVDSLDETLDAGDTIREHRREIAPTYGDLLAGGRYDPTNPEHLSYAQALNLENYLYLGALGFGVAQMLIGAGVFMLITGVALGVTGLALRRRAS